MVQQMVEFVQHARRSLIPCLIISGSPPPVGRVCISHGNHFNLSKVVAQDTFVNATIHGYIDCTYVANTCKVVVGWNRVQLQRWNIHYLYTYTYVVVKNKIIKVFL